MKKSLVAFLLFFSFGCFGQEVGLKNVRQQIRPIVEPIWKTPKECLYTWPTILLVRNADNVEVKDEDFIPEQYFAIYRLGWLSPHAPLLYLVVRRDKGYIINMKQSLNDVILGVLSIAQRFNLSEDELVLTIRTVLNGYTLNAKNAGGEKILKGPMKPVYPESYLLPY